MAVDQPRRLRHRVVAVCLAVGALVTGGAGPAAAAEVGAPGPAGVVNRSGEPWNSGVYYPGSNRGKVERHEAFGEWRDNPVDVSVDWQARSTWSDITDSQWLYRTWVGTPQTKVFGVAMLPEDVPGVSLAACAAGEYDAQWVAFGESIAEYGMADEIVVRLGWEFNGDWQVWSADDPVAFAECWRRIHTAAETVAPELRWSWDVFRGPGRSVRDAREAYPGDAYVDVVGISDYDGFPAVTNEASWQRHYAGDFGLRFWADFAAQRGKAFAVPEWGIYPGTGWEGNNGGDNAYYMEKMAGFFGEVGPNLAYEAYFNQSAEFIAGEIHGSDRNPEAKAMYERIW